MKNIDKIKNMNDEEFSNFISDNMMCDMCVCNKEIDNEYACMAIGCLEGIKRWLNGEVDNE